MINLEFDNAVVMRQKAALESMLVSNPDTAANIRKLITQEIAKARAAISQSAKGAMASDPRQARPCAALYIRAFSVVRSTSSIRGAARLPPAPPSPRLASSTTTHTSEAATVASVPHAPTKWTDMWERIVVLSCDS